MKSLQMYVRRFIIIYIELNGLSKLISINVRLYVLPYPLESLCRIDVGKLHRS